MKRDITKPFGSVSNPQPRIYYYLTSLRSRLPV